MVQAHIIELSFYAEQALPLSQLRFFRLAICSPMVARSPARRLRDGRETSGNTSGEISRVMSTPFPGNGRTVATAMPLNVRQDGSQDNLHHAGASRRTTRKMVTQQPRRNSRNGQRNILQAAPRNLVVSFQP
jgi:hypothetical protein